MKVSSNKKPSKTKEIKFISKQINDINREIQLTEKLKQESQNKFEKHSLKITETKVKLEQELVKFIGNLIQQSHHIQ